MNLNVRGHNVFIRPEKLPETTADGKLHLVHTGRNSALFGYVVAVGDGPEFAHKAVVAALHEFYDNAEVVNDWLERYIVDDHIVKVGDKVIFAPEVGEELVFEKEVLIAMREDEILAVVG